MTELPQVEGVTHRWVEARGIRFHVAEAGSGDDVVLLLHGWPQHWYEWRHLMPALADRHRVIAPDLRGFGWSDAPRAPSGYLKENLATDVLALLDALGLERVKLVGHDWGGWIGFLLCLRAPERFERYLALNIVPPWPSRRATLLAAWRLWYQWLISLPWVGYIGHRTGVVTRLALHSATRDGATWDDGADAEFCRNLSEPARARACVQMYRQFTLREAVPVGLGRYAQARLHVPTRVVFGTGDLAISPRMLAGCEAHADDMSVELVEGCGHFIVDERPELVADRARAFLES